MAELYRDAVIATQEAQVGYSSGSSKSSTYSKFMDSYNFYNYKKDGSANWCAILNDYCVLVNTNPQTADEARSVVYEPNKDNCGAGCKWKIDYYKRNNAFYPHKAKGCPAEVGDEVFFYDKKYVSSENPYGVYHTGRVVDWDDQKIYTVEGNTNGRGDVSRRSYSYGDSRLYGYGRPKWTANSRPSPKPQPEPEPTPEPTEKKFKVSVSDFLNIRTKPDINSDKVGEFYDGAVVTILEERDGWGKISGDCWVSLKYLTAM